MSIKYITGVIYIGCLTGFLGCRDVPDNPSEEIAPITVGTALVKRGDLKEYRTFVGLTRYQQSEDIRATVTGYITHMPFRLGDAIKKGQVFASIRTKEQDALDEAVQIDSSLAQFTAPIEITSNASGSISGLNVVPEDFVTEGDVMATVSQPNTLIIQLSVPFEYSAKIRVGTPCTLLIPGYPEQESRVSGVLTSTDSMGQAQHYLVKVQEMTLPENLKVSVRVAMEKAENALTIPHKALQTNELLTDFWVLKVVDDTLAVRKKVTPLLETDSLVQIRADDVRENDRVVTTGGYQMADSTRIRMEEP